MKQKINLRLALIAMLAVLTTTVGITLICYNMFQQRVRKDLRIHAELLNDSGIFQQWYEDQDWDSGEKAFENLKEEGIRITWIDVNGDVLFDSDAAVTELTNHLDRPEIVQAMAEGTGEIIRNSDTMHRSIFYYALRLDNGTVIRVASEASNMTNVFMTSFPFILILIAVIIGLCTLLGHMLTTQLLQPLNEMAENLDGNAEPAYKELEPFMNKIRAQHENILGAARSRQDFTANVSHELKTPLTAISGYAEILENHMVDPEQEAYIAGQIRHNSNRLLAVINDIIRLSELDYADQASQFETVDLAALADECCDALQVNARAKRITLSCSCGDSVVNGDRYMLKEMIENLVQNAITYNKEGGSVRVVATSEKGHAILRVQDTGIGIPADQQERIFERFYRVDKSRSRATGGTGLGLAIVKHIAELHSAKILLDSEPGKGSRFTVTF